MLKRTLHSIVNRTPRRLIHEIILVNDNSTSSELYEPLSKYVTEHFSGLVQVYALKRRRGMVVSRLEGARLATGDVLVNMHWKNNIYLHLACRRVNFKCH